MTSDVALAVYDLAAAPADTRRWMEGRGRLCQR